MPTPPLKPLRPPPETDLPVLGAPQTFASVRPLGDESDGATPVTLADTAGRVLVGEGDSARFRYLVLRGGRVSELSVRVSQPGAVLELDAIQFAVRRTLEVTNHATVITHIRDYPAGLDLDGDALLDLTGGRLHLLFHVSPADEGVHWGLRAKGDWQDRFYRLIQDRQITVGAVELGRVTPAEPLVIFDGEYTYITLGPPVYESPIQSQVRFAVIYEPAQVPEPLTISLVGLGSAVLLRRRR
ncbi:MAG: PEP-CTERM sorting domain-containing protein [Planctomycetota bacterium]